MIVFCCTKWILTNFSTQYSDFVSCSGFRHQTYSEFWQNSCLSAGNISSLASMACSQRTETRPWGLHLTCLGAGHIHYTINDFHFLKQIQVMTSRPQLTSTGHMQYDNYMRIKKSEFLELLIESVHNNLVQKSRPHIGVQIWEKHRSGSRTTISL